VAERRHTGRASREERVREALAWLERYREIVDDPAAFRAVLEEPPPVDLLVPREDPGDVAGSLEARGFRVERFPWAPRHIRVHAPSGGPPPGAGLLPEVILGRAYAQGLSSAAAPLPLAPLAGHLVLDACSAPGGKTLLLDSLAGGRARILAVDPSRGRAGLIVQSLARHGVAGTVIALGDAGGLPRTALFDRVLVDAPCTGEGTFRVPAPRYAPSGEEGLARARVHQRRILARALDLLAPGGLLVYSTCSLAPEEDEAIVAEALATRDDVALLSLPDELPGLPGLTSWRGERWPAELARTRRIFPHHTGSWGFFVALLRKATEGARVARPRRAPAPPAPPVEDPAARETLCGFMAERFGVPREALDPYLVIPRGRDLWVLRRPAGADLDLGPLHVVAPGLRALRRTGRGWRPTTGFLRLLGPALRERVVHLDRRGGDELLARRELPAPPGAPTGLVALSVEGRVVGAGFVENGRLVPELPRSLLPPVRPGGESAGQ